MENAKEKANHTYTPIMTGVDKFLQ